MNNLSTPFAHADVALIAKITAVPLTLLFFLSRNISAGCRQVVVAGAGAGPTRADGRPKRGAHQRGEIAPLYNGDPLLAVRAALHPS